jgi:hypothetical protein
MILFNYHICASRCADVDVCNQMNVEMCTCVCMFVCVFVLACVCVR